MKKPPDPATHVMIAGAGIAGLSLGLTLHQLGIPFTIYESAAEIKPLGVGINIQPSAVRELFDLSLEDELLRSGVRIQNLGYFSKHGAKIWEEPRGLAAGYLWPQYAVFRGRFQTELLNALHERCGTDCVRTDYRAKSFEQTSDSVILNFENRESVEGALLVGADGIKSSLRAFANPKEGAPIWGGAILWRGTTRTKPFADYPMMATIGYERQKFVIYPICDPDPQTGEVTLNWIAELKFDVETAKPTGNWNSEANLADFLPQFEEWSFDWLDIPSIIRNADQIYEYPLVDRDPLDNWIGGRVTLIGDAAHAMYPMGSNGATQAILDTRILGRELKHQGICANAIEAYELERRPKTSRLIQSNRNQGPDEILEIVEQNAPNGFRNIDAVVSYKRRHEIASKYKKLAGFDPDILNAQASILGPVSPGFLRI